MALHSFFKPILCKTNFSTARQVPPGGGLVFAFLMFFLGLGSSSQVAAQCNALPCDNVAFEIVPMNAVSFCGSQADCGRYYFQVRLVALGNYVPPGNPTPAQFCLAYNDLTASVDVGSAAGLSTVNAAATQACYPATFSNFPLGVDGNKVTFQLQNTQSIPDPQVIMTQVAGRYQADLFVIAVDAFPGDQLEFSCSNTNSGLYQFGAQTCYPTCFSDVFNVPTPAAETEVCLRLGTFDNNLMPVEAVNASATQADVDFLEVVFIINSDQPLVTPVLQNFVVPPVISYIKPVPGTTNWIGYARFAVPSGIAVPALGQTQLFNIKIDGPVNKSLKTKVDVCLGDGQIRRTGSACKSLCYSGEQCKSATFDGAEPCGSFPPVNIQITGMSSSVCTTLQAKVALNFQSTFENFELIKIGVRFDVGAGVTMNSTPGTNTIGCPSPNTGCTPGYTNCFRADGNTMYFCFSPATAQSVTNGAFFIVEFTAPDGGCVNGATIVEALIDQAAPYGPCVPLVLNPVGFPLCSPILSGTVVNENGAFIDDVDIQIKKSFGGCVQLLWPNNAPWAHCICDLSNYKVTPKVKFSNQWLNGVTTYDLSLIHGHITAIERDDPDDLFDSPYKYFAADADRSKTVEDADIVHLRKLILGIYDNNIPNGVSWRYIDASFVFPPLPPDDYPFPTPLNLDPSAPEDWTGAVPNPGVNFIAVKVGDVNVSHDVNLAKPAGHYPLGIAAQATPSGGYLTVPVVYQGSEAATAAQLGLRFNPHLWEWVGVSTAGLAGFSPDCFGLTHLDKGEVRFAWFTAQADQYLQPGQTMFNLTLRARKPYKGNVLPIQTDDAILHNVAFLPEGQAYAMEATATAAVAVRDKSTTAEGVLRAECAPNPSSGAVTFTLGMPTDAKASVWVFNAYGVRQYYREISLSSGQDLSLSVPEAAQWPSGVYVWKVKSGKARAEGRLIRQ